MAFYSYHATDSSGRSIKGTMEGADEGAIVSKLQDQGYFPIKVQKALDGAPSRQSRRGFAFARRVLSREVAAFTYEMGSLLDAGFPIDKSLSLLAEAEQNPAFREVMLDLCKGVQSGQTFAESLERHPKIFSQVYVNTIRAGEAGGALEGVLERLRKFMEETEKLKDDIASAMIYPLILTVAGGAAVIIMLAYVIPKFSVIFDDAGGVMPLPTRVLLAVNGLVMSYWWAPVAAFFIAGFEARRRGRTESGRLALDGMKLRIPLIGPVMKKVILSRFARTLGTLLQGGLPVLEALRISINTIGNAFIQKEIQPVVEGVRRGRGIAAPLKEIGSFPSLAVQMLTVGEETGRLDEMLVRFADKYDREVSTTIKRLLSLLEPAIILVMAVIVGFIVISLLLAVFSLNDITM